MRPRRAARIIAFIATVSTAGVAVAQVDERRAATERLVAEADRLSARRTVASYKEAAALYKRALTSWHDAGDIREQARTLEKLANAHHGFRDYRSAIARYREAASIWESLNDVRGQASTFNGLGEVLLGGVGASEALPYLNRSLALWESIGEPARAGPALTNLGEAYHILGENQKALEYFHRALPLRRLSGDVHGEVITIHDIGMIHFYLGDGQQAIDWLRDAIARNHDRNDGTTDAHLLGSLARAYAVVGERQRALDAYAESLRQWRQVGDRWGEALTLGNIGGIYQDMGQYDEALARYRVAFRIFRRTNQAGMAGRMLEQTGEAYAEAGRSHAALATLRGALSILRSVHDPHRESDALQSLGSVHAALGHRRMAASFYERALALKRRLGDRRGEADVLQGIGDLRAAAHRYAGAIALYELALSLRQDHGDRDGEARTLMAIARVEQERGDLSGAQSALERALEIVDWLRASVIDQDFRASYVAARHAAYELYIDVLMRRHELAPEQGYDARALEASERARARSFLESLSEARVDIRADVDPALLDRERAIQRSLNAKEQYRMRLLAGEHTTAQVAAVDDDLRAVMSEYRDVEARIRESSREFASLVLPRVLGLADIQRQLDAETLLLEYSLGDARSYVWVVSYRALTAIALPKRATIETAARRLNHLLRAGRNSLARGPQRLALEAMSRLVLAPVAARLGNRRLLIASDGALHYVPFAAMPLIDSSPGSGGITAPLAAGHDIAHVAAASIIPLLRSVTADRSARTGVAVFGDPVFHENDPRVAPGRVLDRRPSSRTDATRPVGPPRLRLPRLKFSRDEVKHIAAAAGSDTFSALDFKASRATLTALDLSRYAVLHFATHALVDTADPEQSGIVLSLVDERGRPQDGFVRLREIYNLRLPVDLAVLSACETALGPEIRGEGVLGLTRAFMYAGAPRVVVSLWNVSDQATAEFMKVFYRAMFVYRLRPSAALRVAQLAMSRSTRWHEAYYWAGFVLHGDWN